jgi:hypothetical protein
LGIVFFALATIAFSNWFACLLNRGHLSYALMTKNVEGWYLAQGNTVFLNGQMKSIYLFCLQSEVMSDAIVDTEVLMIISVGGMKHH